MSKRHVIPVEFLEEADGFKEVIPYPDNEQAVNIFSSVLTQWRTTNGHRYGLDYNTLDFVFNVKGVAQGEREEIFDQVRIMEQAALKEFARQK